MNIYSNFISDIYAVLSGDYEQYFVPIDTILEEVPNNLDYIIRPSWNFGTSVSYTNLRDYEDDLIINLQIFRNHDSNVDIVEVAVDIQNKLKDLQSFVYEGWKFSIIGINLLKNFDTRYTGVTVQIVSRKLEQVEEEPIDWTTRPLTFIAAEPNTKIIIRRYGTGIISTSIKYKFNINDEWINYTPGDEITLAKIGDMVMFENTGSTRLSYDTANYFNVESTGSFYARGQVYSLTNYQQPYNFSFYRLFEDCEGLLSTPIFPSGGNGSAYVFYQTFMGCTNLKEAEDINYDTMTSEGVCMSMFQDCVNLIYAPKIKATILGAGCCNGMFQNCTSLLEPPELPSLSATTNVYRAMFMNCYSLRRVPELPATTLNQYCYYQMFQGCINLREAPEVLPATSISGYSYQAMFSGCKKLKKAPQLNFTNAPNYCCQNMFNSCTSLEEGPSTLLPDVVEVGAYDGMFTGCSNLVKAPIIYASSVGQYGFRGMFYNCTLLNDVQDVLSANMTGTNAYQNMFYSCINLTKAPELPMTSLESTCYQNMFRDCRSLIESPILPATILPANAYQNMFLGCTKLEKAGEIKATTLNTSSMNAMFQGCTALSDVTVNFTAWSPANATTSWFASVPQEVGRVFRCPSSLPNTRGVNNIPVNWTKVDI